MKKQAERVKKRLNEIEKEIRNLAFAMRKGADPDLLISDQNELKADRDKQTENLDDIETELRDMPDVETLQSQAMLMRIQLIEQHRGKDWQSIPYDETRRFLQFLFGDNPRKSGNGIIVRIVDGRWEITFKGRMECHALVDGRPIDPLAEQVVREYNREVGKIQEKLRKLQKPCKANW